MNHPPKIPNIPRQVPDFEILELAPKRRDFCVAIFVINEGERIRYQMQKMRPLAEIVDLVIADGGSTDGSLDQPTLRENRLRTLLTKTGLGRLSAQMRMAFAYALDQGYKGIITVDGNDKDDTFSVPSFVDALRQGYDHIQGSRYIPGGQGINTPLSRYLAVRWIHSPLISLAAGFHYTDSTNGFRAYSSRLLIDRRVAPFRDVFWGYELHYYLAIRAARLGYRCLELPVTRTYPAKSKTPTKISPVKGNLLVLITLLKTIVGHYNP
jgi:glycosyltransferase involved in cell wall biosynthesis